MLNLNTLKALTLGDWHTVRRDSMLSWMIFIPVLAALIIRLVLPRLSAWLLSEFSFDLSPYYVLILSYFFLLTVPIVFGAVVGFMLLDERDDRTITALQVTPLTINRYLLYRLGLPVALSIVLSLLVYPVFGVAPVAYSRLIPVAIVAALSAPMLALFLGAFAENKVAGFALMKGAGAVLILPVAAYFVPLPWQWLAGLLPTYWPMKAYWLAVEGGQMWPYVLGGLVAHGVVVAYFLRRFQQVLSR